MKKIRNIIVWSLIPLSIQLSVLYFLNNHFWNTESSFKIVKVDEKNSSQKLKINLKLPEDAKDIKVSYNGKHVSYFLDNKLVVQNTIKGDEKKVDLPDNVTISNYRWLPDRDRLIMAEKHVNGKRSFIVFSSYDQDKGERTELVDNHKKEVRINLPDSRYEVENMTMSTATSVVYIKVSGKGLRNRIYHMNIMSQIENFQMGNSKIGNMEVLYTKDKFIYEDLTNKKLAVSGAKKSIIIDGKKNLALLGIDNDDNIYVCDKSLDTVGEIYHGSLETTPDQWECDKLSKQVDRQDIIVSISGEIYINSNERGEVLNINNNKITKYKGNFLGLYNNGVVSISEGKLVNSIFK